MNDLFVFVAHNTLFTLVFALCVYVLTRLWCNPPLAHLLWLLVLLKLVAPPIIQFEWSAVWLPDAIDAGDQTMAAMPRIEAQTAFSDPRFAGGPTAPTTASPATASPATYALASAANVERYEFVAGMEPFWIRARPVLFWFWVGGAVLGALITMARTVRFERLLRDTLPASERVQRHAREIAGKLGIRRVPDVRYVESAEVPLLWCAGLRPTIVLPMRLLRRLDDQQMAMILAHELAHLRRGDHWVRAIEMIVSIVYWWNPLVQVIRRQIHQAEDLCCDAWVRWSYPQSAKSYAEVVFKTAESLSAPQISARLLPASPFLRSLSLKARIEMILESRFSPQVSVRSMLIAALFACLVLPAFIQTTATKTLAGEADDAVVTPPVDVQTSSTSDFPYIVRFEQGVTDFKEGDDITILEVRGTAETFTPGNIYCIKGTYALASHDGAMLAAYTTAKKAADGTGPSSKVQTMNVDRGKGTFTLFLPMSCEGWPHVSFYAGGQSVGGNYVGTGDSVLKKWWGTSKTDQDESSASAGASSVTTDRDAKFPYAVNFEQGVTHFKNGDVITILEVRGTAETFTPGNIYWIHGTYSLASQERATVAAYTTAKHARDGRSVSLKVQSTVVDQGDGTFTLYLPMSYEGWPHVSFYVEGQGNGGNYFGTGDSVLKKWWGS